MTHPLVTQLHFARSEFQRCMEGVSAQDAVKRVKPLNCLSWIVGHLAVHEQVIWLKLGLGREPKPDLEKLVGYGSPASTPPWDEMWATWHGITSAANEFLNDITEEMLENPLYQPAPDRSESIGVSLLRNIYHYWFHVGDAHAVRQVLGHADLPVFVGQMDAVRIR